MKVEQDPTWWRRRLSHLAARIADGDYFVPAEAIAEAILYGRPKWGSDPEFIGENTPLSRELPHR